MSVRVTRLAPSPTGALHLGNARTFLVNWALARRHHWRILLRIEDLDGPRVKPESVATMLGTLRWLGIDWDEPPLTQSDNLDPYRTAMRTLAHQRLVYPCSLTRRDLEQAVGAPHAGEHELRAGPESRPTDPRASAFDDPHTNYRFITPDRTVPLHDAIAGSVTAHPFREIGDFVVWTKRGVPAYQLAVVVDDARQGVTDVVRGDDLLPSAARQTLLYEALGAAPPRWWHLPLVVGPDGRRLAKRHGDTRVDRYHAAGVRAERLIALLARWSGVALGEREMLSANDFLAAFDPALLPRSPIVFTERDHAWLSSG